MVAEYSAEYEGFIRAYDPEIGRLKLPAFDNYPVKFSQAKLTKILNLLSTYIWILKTSNVPMEISNGSPSYSWTYLIFRIT